MDREEIYDLVIDIADRKGSTDAQMLKHLKQKLEKLPVEELFYGLYKVFLSNEKDYFNRQQLAGKMLFKIRPSLRFDLPKVIKDCLSTYNLSIEELPFYLRDLCGIERVKLAISQVEDMPLNESEKNSLETFKFWLKLLENG